MDPSYSNPAFGAGAGGQPQQPVFGAGGMQTPISSGTGDIVLAPEKKSHKGVIIALILAVLIIGGLFVAVFLMRGGGNSGASGDAKTAFNKYANYLLYGEDSDKALEGEYDETSVYKLDEMRSENAQIVGNYFNVANELLDNFEALIDGSADTGLVTTVNNYRANFELVRLTFDKEYIVEEDLINEVLNNNLDDTEIWIAAKYNNLAKSSYENIRQYAEVAISYYKLYAEYLEKAKSAGCLDMEGNVTCEIDNEIGDQVEDAQTKLDTLEIEATTNTIKGCFGLQNILNGEKVIDDGSTSSEVEGGED